ncbi:MAG: hypothetical protein QM237_04140, partial [Bacteroidota bacterium]|nr:hypothetical protein [Bacteroidota bacterium]
MSKHLAKVASISFWGKVVLYQLSYVRDYFKTPCQGRFHCLLGQGRALPTELRPQRGFLFRDCKCRHVSPLFKGIDEVFSKK